MRGLGLGLGLSRRSAGSAPPSGVPVVVSPPVISGLRVPTFTLTATQGTYTESPTSYVNQWYDDGVAIIGANSLSYTIGMGVSGVVTFGVVPVNAAGSGDEAFASNPKTIIGTTIVAHYDASDTSTISHTAGAVSSIANKTGGAALEQATGANQPLTGTVTQNGLNTIKFDGTDDVLTVNDSLDSLSGGANTVLFVGVGLFSGNSNGVLFANQNGHTTFRYGFTRNGSSTSSMRFNHSNSGTNIFSVVGGTAGAHVVGHRRDGVTMEGFLEGTGSNTGMEDRSDSSFWVGAGNLVGGGASAMVFCQVVAFKEAMSDDHINEISNYLETYWDASWLDV